MCTVIKVKRKITDDPVDCLILECKRKKFMLETKTAATESQEEPLQPNEEQIKFSFDTEKNRIDSIKQILKYAGSAKNEVKIHIQNNYQKIVLI